MIRVKVDLKRVKPKIKKATKLAQIAIDEQVLKDTNDFAPFDTGNLINSSLRSSMIGQGRLVWDTPYARRLYYNPQYNFSKDQNPKAGGLWFERAKAKHRRQWAETAQEAIERWL